MSVTESSLGTDGARTLTWVSRRPERIPAHPRVQTCTWDALGRPRGELLVNTTIVGLHGGPRSFPVDIEFDALDPGARAFYRALGFREERTLRGYYDGVEDAVRMTRRLGRRSVASL